MRHLRRTLLIVGIIGGLLLGLVLADQMIRRRVERQVSEVIVAELGGEVTTEIGGWPFSAAWVTDRVADVRITVKKAHVSVGERSGIIESAELTAVGLSPVKDLTRARAERLDARVRITWGQLTTLLGIVVSQVEGDRVSARTSVELFGVVGVIEVQAGLGVKPDGTLILSDPSASAAGIGLPKAVVQLAVDSIAGQLRLPTLTGLFYEGLEIGPDGVAARLHGTDVALAELG